MRREYIRVRAIGGRLLSVSRTAVLWCHGCRARLAIAITVSRCNLRTPLSCHPEPKAKDLPSTRASGYLEVISSLSSPFMVRPREDRTNGLGCGDWAFILDYPRDPSPRAQDDSARVDRLSLAR